MTTRSDVDELDELPAPLGYSLDYVAARLGVARATVQGLISRGELAAYHVGAAIRVTKTSFDRYLAEILPPE